MYNRKRLRGWNRRKEYRYLHAIQSYILFFKWGSPCWFSIQKCSSLRPDQSMRSYSSMIWSSMSMLTSSISLISSWIQWKGCTFWKFALQVSWSSSSWAVFSASIGCWVNGTGWDFCWCTTVTPTPTAQPSPCSGSWRWFWMWCWSLLSWWSWGTSTSMLRPCMIRQLKTLWPPWQPWACPRLFCPHPSVGLDVYQD